MQFSPPWANISCTSRQRQMQAVARVSLYLEIAPEDRSNHSSKQPKRFAKAFWLVPLKFIKRTPRAQPTGRTASIRAMISLVISNSLPAALFSSGHKFCRITCSEISNNAFLQSVGIYVNGKKKSNLQIPHRNLSEVRMSFVCGTI